MEHIVVRDINICYKCVGKGYPLVLIMGMTANMDWWDPEFIDALSEKNSILMFDNRGSGRTVAPDEGNFTCETLADDTIALMDAKGIERAHILGMSMGGLIAQELAIKYPKRVNKLILACTFCGGQHMIQASNEVMKTLIDRSGGLDGLFERTLKLMFTKDFLDTNQEFVKNFKERYIKAPINELNAARQFIACAKADTFNRLSEIKNPTLIATGTDDPLIPPQNSRILAGRIPCAKLVEYPGCSHGFISEARDVFIKDLLDFIAADTDK